MYELSTEETYEDGQIIFKEGAAGDWIYTVESGAVEISKDVAGRKVVVEMVQAGAVFGELGFISSMPRSATARAMGPTTVGIIDRSFLDQEFNKLSGNFRKILKTLAVRLRHTTEIATRAGLRRKEIRVPTVLTLNIRSDAGLVQAFSRDMSIGGMFIRTASPLKVGDHFGLRLNLPEVGDPLEIECEVAWNRIEREAEESLPPGMGVKFVAISEAAQHRLKEELTKSLQTRPLQ